MKRFLGFASCLVFLLLTGCVVGKTATDSGFYSSASPALTIKPDFSLDYLGEDVYSKQPVRRKTYFYKKEASVKNDESLPEGFAIEFFALDQGWRVEPKVLPGDNLPNSGIYSKRIGDRNYYCRAFVLSPEGDSYIEEYYLGKGFQFNKYYAVRSCTRNLSPRKKVTITYFSNVGENIIKGIFGVGGAISSLITSTQVNFFNDFDAMTDQRLNMKKFDDRDIE